MLNQVLLGVLLLLLLQLLVVVLVVVTAAAATAADDGRHRGRVGRQDRGGEVGRRPVQVRSTGDHLNDGGWGRQRWCR